ncbi:hypothetical protein FPV67DRAFT_402317 [Lyophyllum atratum]|nr:hypothetical protein FPV67DRAFT_402317 [Lyophyllum atratum]
MTEDVQPNERPLNRKEATIPIIRPIPASRAPCQRGGYAHSATRYHHKPLNGPQNGTYPFTTSHNHQQYGNQSKRSYHHPHDGPYTKRRRTNYESSTEPRHESAKASSFLLPKPPNKSRKSTKRKVHPEPIELLVDLPPQCRKGAPDYRRLRGQWESVQTQELSTNTGVPLKLGGYTQDCARFIFDDNPGSHSEERSGRPEPVDRTPAQPAALPNPDIVLNKVNDEIIIVENIDDLDNLEGSLLPTFPIRSDFDSDLRYPSPVEPARSKTPEPLEPLRVFTSGVLSLSFIEAHGGSIAFQTLPASSEQPYASGSSVLGDTSSQVLQMLTLPTNRLLCCRITGWFP